MTPERWRQIEALYEAVRARPVEARTVFLAAACAGDEALRGEVEWLLARNVSVEVDVSNYSAAGLAGRRLGVYDVQALLGAGGMGEVYRARDTKLGRDVAVKFLPRAFTSDPERLARFEREAQVLASLNHPNIGAIYGLEEADGVRALVLELVEGETLAERLAPSARRQTPGEGRSAAQSAKRDAGGLPVAEALTIARQIADALDAAHERGIVHRDLKPANIKIRPDGTVKVLDFGIAKALGGDGGGTDLSQAVTLEGTREGLLIGTPAYMSPEQARAQTVDKRADIWAFGCVLYEMLIGRAAFARETITDTLAAIVGSEPDWHALPPATPISVRRLLRRCLEKDPRRRIRDIGEVRFQIEEAATGGSRDQDLTAEARNVVEKRAQSARVPWVIAAICALIAAAIVSWIGTRPRAQPSSLRLELNPPGPEPFSSTGPAFFSVSPNGRYLAFITQTDRRRLWVRSLESGAAQLIPGTEDAWQPFWSPDSRSIAFNSNNLVPSPVKLKRVDLTGGTPVTLADVDSGSRGAWSSQGIILFQSPVDQQLYRISDGGGDPVAVTTLDRTRQETAHRWPVFLADGRKFVFLVQSTNTENEGLYLGSLDSPSHSRLVAARSSVEYSPGYLFYQRDGVLVAHPIDESRGVLGGPAVPIEGVLHNPSNGRVAASVSHTGVLVFKPGSAVSNLLTWYGTDRKVQGTVGPVGRYGVFRVSPDGTRVAVTKRDESGQTSDIWMLGLDRGLPTRFTFDPAIEDSPVWSPDGAQIVFRAFRKGQYQLYRRRIGAGDDDVLLETPQAKSPSGFSPDGRLLLFTQDSGETRSDVWALPMDGARQPFPVIQTPFLDELAVFSPDGRWIAYQSDDSGTRQVYVQAFPSGVRTQVSVDGGGAPAWSANGNTIMYETLTRELMAADVEVAGAVLKVSVPRQILQMPANTGGGIPDFAMDRSGQRILLAASTEERSTDFLSVILNFTPGLDR